MKNDEDILFDYVDSNGNQKKAEVLTMFSLEGRENKYALCSVPTDDGNFDIMAFIVNESVLGEVSFDDITDPSELEEVTLAANHIIGE